MKTKLFCALTVLAVSSQTVHAQRRMNQSLPIDPYLQKEVAGVDEKKIGILKFGSVPYDSIYYWHWDTTAGKWDLSWKTIDMVYNSKKKLTSSLSKMLGTNGWDNFLRETYTYDTNSNALTFTSEIWINGLWTNEYRWIYTYDSNNSITNYLWQQGNGTSWDNYLSRDLTYDSNHNYIRSVSKQWVNGSWKNTTAIFYMYDFNQNRIADSTLNWVDTTWQTNSRNRYGYDMTNNHIYTKSEVWKGWNWENSYQLNFTYDANGNLTLELGERWQNGSWENDYKIEYTSNAHGDPVQTKNYQWNGSVWTKIIEQGSWYDANYTLTDGVNRGYDITNSKLTRGDSTHYFVHSANGIYTNSPLSNEIQLFPNPSDGKFHVQLKNNLPIKNIMIFNLTGEKILEQFSGEISLDVAAKGMYMIHVSDGKHVYHDKILLE